MAESLLAQAVRKVGVDAVIRAVPPEQLAYVWALWARSEQLPPPGDWRWWFYKAGRGTGKTRTGAETVRHWAMELPGCHIALVAPTAADARDVMVEALMTPWNGGALIEVPRYEPSKRCLTWRNGSTATTYSAEEPERLRGPQHHRAWADEVGSWRGLDVWDQLQFGLRLGDRARGIVTGTPRTTPLIKRILAAPTTVVTHGRTRDNIANLDERSVLEMERAYGGTRLGRQELEGELLDDIEGALWTHGVIDRARLPQAPELERVVVAVDPAGSAKRTADVTGIVVAGVAPCVCKGPPERHAFVLEDLSSRYNPDEMGRISVAAYWRKKADRLVAEDNFGGKIVESIIQLTDPRVAYKAVHASRGKLVRAEPVAALYERGIVHHVGGLAHLEDELVTYTPDSGFSPGRMDAMVWALTELMLGEQAAGFTPTTSKHGRRT